jgi:hypothetical protein
MQGHAVQHRQVTWRELGGVKGAGMGRVHRQAGPADAALEISNDLSTDAGYRAYILDHEADNAYDEFTAAWVREHYPEVGENESE